MHQLVRHSPEFRERWEAQEVRDHADGAKLIVNPLVGELELTYEALSPPREPELLLCLYSAPKGSPTAARLRRLAELTEDRGPVAV
ncbi:hypothetical protein NKH77_24405 [Streptomyces sp. M19]